MRVKKKKKEVIKEGGMIVCLLEVWNVWNEENNELNN